MGCIGRVPGRGKMAHVGYIESVAAHIFQSGELHLKKFRNAGLMDAPVLRAEVEVPRARLEKSLKKMLLDNGNI